MGENAVSCAVDPAAAYFGVPDEIAWAEKIGVSKQKYSRGVGGRRGVCARDGACGWQLSLTSVRVSNKG